MLKYYTIKVPVFVLSVFAARQFPYDGNRLPGDVSRLYATGALSVVWFQPFLQVKEHP